MNPSSWITLFAAVAGSLVTGAFAIFLWTLNRNKLVAEVEKIHAETDKLGEEVKDLTSARLLREVERLLAWNKQQGEMIESQRLELDKLRIDILEYAAREIRHAAENTSLRMEISQLKQNIELKDSVPANLGGILRSGFPVAITHTESEFDGQSGAIDSDK